MRKGFVYLAVVLDWFSRRVLSWRVSITMEASFCIAALEEALDQGSQFTCAAFTGVLANNEIRISMDGKGAWRDNVFVERLWRTVKYEEIYLRAYGRRSTYRSGKSVRSTGATSVLFEFPSEMIIPIRCRGHENLLTPYIDNGTYQLLFRPWYRPSWRSIALQPSEGPTGSRGWAALRMISKPPIRRASSSDFPVSDSRHLDRARTGDHSHCVRKYCSVKLTISTQALSSRRSN
jgi:transposase InsO family protein